jgi:hypothetical protein
MFLCLIETWASPMECSGGHCNSLLHKELEIDGLIRQHLLSLKSQISVVKKGTPTLLLFIWYYTIYYWLLISYNKNTKKFMSWICLYFLIEIWDWDCTLGLTCHQTLLYKAPFFGGRDGREREAKGGERRRREPKGSEGNEGAPPFLGRDGRERGAKGKRKWAFVLSLLSKKYQK